MRTYAINTALAMHRSDQYFQEINEFLKSQRFFRYHVSGDILNAEYFKRMVQTAEENPKCDILVFSKRYEIINDDIKQHGDLPDNLHILMSGWYDKLHPDNPYHLPETNLFDEKHPPEPDWLICGGNCFNCACRGLGCWTAKNGDTIAFHKH